MFRKQQKTDTLFVLYCSIVAECVAEVLTEVKFQSLFCPFMMKVKRGSFNCENRTWLIKIPLVMLL